MRINELTGIKQSSFKRAIDAAEPDEEFDDSNAGALSDAVNQLRLQGWRVIGKGYYAYVLKAPVKDYVIKLSYGDSGYQKFLKFIRSNPGNPHVPRIRGLGVKLSPDVYAIRMEQLIPITRTDPVLAQYIAPGLPVEFDSIWHEDNIDFLKASHPELYQTFVSLYRMDPDNDIDYTNVMRRGDTLVITDPFFS